MSKTFPEWLSEMERLDKGATKDWDCDAFVRAARTELPRAVRIIKTLVAYLDPYLSGDDAEKEIEKILNGV